MIVHILHDSLRTDRHTLFTKEAEEQGFEYQVWDACKNGAVKPRVNINECHRKIVQDAKDNGEEERIIMEDDCKWMGHGAFQYFLDKKPKEYDLYLSSVLNGRLMGDGEVSGWTGLQCYIIHQKFYDRFLASNPNVDIDHAISKENFKGEDKARIICCYPFATMEHDTFSDNTKKFHNLKRLYHDRRFYGQ